MNGNYRTETTIPVNHILCDNSNGINKINEKDDNDDEEDDDSYAKTCRAPRVDQKSAFLRPYSI